jgi:voltage-gated potassium channel
VTARPGPALAPWQQRLHTIVFESDTPAGRAFDVAVVLAILASTVVAMLETVSGLSERVHGALYLAEWIFTVLFTIEYVVRLVSVERPLRYATSFYGVVDLLAVLPTYASLVFPGAQALIVIRALRLLRIFRVLKLARYLSEAHTLRSAIAQSRAKIIVFLSTVLISVTIMGAVMYLVEGPERGFTSIPVSMYWAVVTMTTVGYGDIAPQTAFGQVLASLLMILGYALIIVPTGIVSAEMVSQIRRRSGQACPSCLREDHEVDALHCKWCGARL